MFAVPVESLKRILPREDMGYLYIYPCVSGLCVLMHGSWDIVLRHDKHIFICDGPPSKIPIARVWRMLEACTDPHARFIFDGEVCYTV
jgi:hypothetical protein